MLHELLHSLHCTFLHTTQLCTNSPPFTTLHHSSLQLTSLHCISLCLRKVFAAQHKQQYDIQYLYRCEYRCVSVCLNCRHFSQASPATFPKYFGSEFFFYTLFRHKMHTNTHSHIYTHMSISCENIILAGLLLWHFSFCSHAAPSSCLRRRCCCGRCFGRGRLHLCMFI